MGDLVANCPALGHPVRATAPSPAVAMAPSGTPADAGRSGGPNEEPSGGRSGAPSVGSSEAPGEAPSAGSSGAGTAFTRRWIAPAGRTGLGAWIAQPRRPDPAAPALVAVHGIKRGVREQAAAFAPLAAAAGRTVIAPEFDALRWPSFQQAVRRGRADLAFARLLDDLGLQGLVPGPSVDLVGYSAGAQFAHRFAMLHPQRVRRLTLCAAGWYTMPDEAPFPYGLGAGDGAAAPWGPLMQARLGEYLALPITITVGAHDDVADVHTRRNPALDGQQGQDRRTRACRYAAALERAARQRGLPAPTLAVLPGAGHDFAACLAAGLGPLALNARRQPR
ncbi:MAG: alpha/beta hydrolase [Pseudomonadota bacterium]